MKRQATVLAAAVLVAGACKDSTGVPDLNNPTVESVSGPLTPSILQTLTTGILDQERRALDYPFLVFPGTMARDYLRMDNSESRFITETLEGPPSPGGFVARGFTPYYTAIRAENFLLEALPRATAEISAGQKSAMSGLVRTLKANDFYRVWETRGDRGLPIDVADPDKVAPILCAPKALDAMAALLDSAYADLQAAKAAKVSSFPVNLPAGWTSVGGDYSDIDTFIQYNRGLKGKVDVYRGIVGKNAGAFTSAIAALNIALAGVGTDAASLADGPYYVFSTLSGEYQNPLFDSRIHFQPSVWDSLQAGDLRKSKIIVRKNSKGEDNPATIKVDNYSFSTLYDPAVTVTSNAANQSRPIPILKNEELYLLRAQAKIGNNDLLGAASDLNVVRSASGGLPAVALTSQTQAIDALLYEKRYSLLTDGPQRFVDLRSYGRLNAASYPTGKSQLSPYTSDPYNTSLPFPQAEIDARGGDVTCH